MEIRIIEGHSEGYQDVLGIRHSVLKKPAYVGVTPEVIFLDQDSTHFMLIEDGKNLGCVSLRLTGSEATLRQMAVVDEIRSKGCGRKLISVLEDYVRARKVKSIKLEAHASAVEFYAKQNYSTLGNRYIITGVTHIPMGKRLS